MLAQGLRYSYGVGLRVAAVGFGACRDRMEDTERIEGGDTEGENSDADLPGPATLADITTHGP